MVFLLPARAGRNEQNREDDRVQIPLAWRKCSLRGERQHQVLQKGPGRGARRPVGGSGPTSDGGSRPAAPFRPRAAAAGWGGPGGCLSSAVSSVKCFFPNGGVRPAAPR